MLGRLVQFYRQRIVEVTGGLDSSHGQFEMSLTMFSLMREYFVVQLRGCATSS